MIKSNEKKEFPVLPLRNTVLFPQQIFPVYIGREQSLNLIDSLPKQGKDPMPAQLPKQLTKQLTLPAKVNNL